MAEQDHPDLFWAEDEVALRRKIDASGRVGSIQLVSSYRGFNLLAAGDEYCAVPQKLGAGTTVIEQQRDHPELIWAEDEAALRHRINSQRLWRRLDPLQSDTPLNIFGLPEVLEIEPIHTCNLRCIMCHVSYEKLSKQRLDIKFLDHIQGLEGKWAKLGSLYEPVAHPDFDRIVRGLTERGMDIDLITNGTLFTESLIERTKDCNFVNVTISFDGIRPETYERIRGRANFAMAIERIRAFKRAVKEHNPHCYFQVNYTIMRSNVDEIDEAVDFWEAEGFDHIGFIGMVKRDDNPMLEQETIEPVIDRIDEKLRQAARKIVNGRYRISVSSPRLRQIILGKGLSQNHGTRTSGLVASDNPDARTPVTPSEHFQNGEYPGMQVDCRSPFKFARLSYDGNVYLCHQFPVGSIYDKTLLDIWHGEPAEHVRSLVKGNVSVCHACEYYQYCIKANEVDYRNPDNFVSENKIKNVGFSFPYSFVEWMNHYYAAPCWVQLTAADLADETAWYRKGLIEADSLKRLHKLAKQAPPPLETIPIMDVTRLGRYLGYGVFFHDGMLYGVPDRIWPLDLTDRKTRERDEIVSAASLGDLRAGIAPRLRWFEFLKAMLIDSIATFVLRRTNRLNGKTLIDKIFDQAKKSRCV